MKTQVFSLTIFISLLMIINSHNLQNQKQNHKENGTEYKTKGLMGFAIVKEYLKAHPQTTIEELKDTFHNALLGRWGAWNFIEDDIEAARNLKEETSMYRHLLKEEYILISGDGVKFVVSNQWEKANVLNLLQIAKNEGWSYEIVRQ